ncbi:MAG: prolipoprotein diacylglyceryl transferase [Acidimicrobiales bacterium]|nr:prolipoprotein diacylglyceryl transferase [Acidimicrobiales bacterium]
MVTFGCDLVADVEPQALGFTYWFQVANEGEPYPVSIHFAGRRMGAKGKLSSRDKFSTLERIEQVVPGSGPIAVTTRVVDVAPGEWHVTASPASEVRTRRSQDRAAAQNQPRLPNASSNGTTGFAPVIQIRAPGARLGAWPALVGLGALVGLASQALLASHTHLSVARVLVVSLIASLVGLVGAKLYFHTGHFLAGRTVAGHSLPGQRGEHRPMLAAGMCIQGFVLGAILTIAVGAQIVGLPLGRVLDVTAPGLLFGMTVGRFGCFFGGCCAGRPTAARWGLWSSDRHVGVRRIPVQLFESTLALCLGLAAFVIVWTTTPHPAGVVFIGAIAGYTLGRQLLFPLRDQPRYSVHGRNRMIAFAGFVIIADIAIAAFVR